MSNNNNLKVDGLNTLVICPENLASAATSILKTEIEQLQMISAVALKLLQLTNNDKLKVKDLIQIIETEPTLTAKVLQIVNSAAYFLPNKVLTISHALNLLGFSTVHQIAIQQLLYNQLINPSSGNSFDQMSFWQHCLFVAALSKQIAIDLNHPHPEAIYTCGLLHDIGKIVLETYGKVSYSDFLDSNGKSDSSAYQNERAFFGLNHADMGLVFCVKWQLPNLIAAVAAFHHELPEANSVFSCYNQEIAIIAFADHIAWLYDIGSGKSLSGSQLSEQMMMLIHFNTMDFASLLAKVDQDMSRTSKFYGIEFPDIQKIRANIVSKAIQLNHLTKPISTNLPISSLTSPHQSLISDEIVSATLEAIHHDFNFDRVILFGMSANRLGLQAKNCWPGDCAEKLLIPSTAIGGQLLQCFRNRTPVIINNSSDKYGQSLLNIMEVDSFIVVPVLHNNRLVNVLYADNVNSRNPIEPDCLVQMLPVANQLAIGLANAKQYQMAKDLAEIDALSQLFNKGKINQLLIEVYGHEAKKLAGFAIGFVDIDHFKNFNDVCGHQAGDDAIKIVAEILRSLSRPDDFVGRYGGEEFLFVLRNTNKEGAIGFAERMRLEIEKRGKVLSSRFNNLSLTVSIGIAMYQTDFLSYIDHVQAADKAMYQAKNQGRNRVIMLD